jgi:dihydrolipoamide dehydrogenase
LELNEHLQTSASHIYAIGDVNGKQMLAHTAVQEGITAVDNILGKKEIINYNNIPACVYSFPEVAVIGLTEKECKDRSDVKYKTVKYSLKGNGKSLADHETDGFVKLIMDTKDNGLLGAHIIAPNATEMISEFSVFQNLEGIMEYLKKSVHPHPSVSEIYSEVAEALLEK